MSEISNNEVTCDNINYCRISCLLMQEGTRRAQETVLGNLPERKTLAQVLSEKQNKLYELMTRQRVLSRSQYDVLYPFTGDMSKIDISLWLILARNITAKSSRKGINWSQSPDRHETHWAHDLIRLREIRNFLFHVSAPELVGEKFAEIRADLVRVLRRLGTSDEVIEYQLNRDLDPQQTRITLHQIREQYMEEQNSLLFRAVQHKRHTRLLTAVVSVLAVLVLIGLTLVTTWYLGKRTPCSKYVQTIASDSGVFYFMARSGWKASPPKFPNTMEVLKKPVNIAAVFHTGMLTERCRVTEDCCDQVKQIQEFQMKGIWDDISYNYLIGNDGVVYEGRGSRYKGAAAWQPSNQAMVALYIFLDYITTMNPENRTKEPLLDRDYRLYGHCQINLETPKNHAFPDSPGAGVMLEIQYWTKHWRPDNLTACDIDKDCMKSQMCCKRLCNGTMT